MFPLLHIFLQRVISRVFHLDILAQNGTFYQITLLNGREAETAISQITGIRGIFIRPGISRITRLIAGLMYSNDRPHLTPLKNLISGIAEVNSRFGGKVPFLGAAGVSPLDVEVVARAVVKATLDESVKGVVDVDMLARLGTSNP